MRTVRGAAEINSWGGYEKQYQVRIDPNLLIKYGLTFDQVMEAVETNNRNVGGGNIREGTDRCSCKASAARPTSTRSRHRHHGQRRRADSRAATSATW